MVIDVDFQPIESDNPAVQRLTDSWVGTAEKTFTGETISELFWENISASEKSLRYPNNEGILVKMLQPNGNWQRGYIRPRVILEFCPDEFAGLEEGNERIQVIEPENLPESPIDSRTIEIDAWPRKTTG